MVVRFRAKENPAMAGSGETAAYFDAAYFAWQGDSAERSARAVVPLVMERFRPESIVDVGCGSGAWLKVFHEHGVDDIVGIDGPHVRRESLRIPPEKFVARDLTEPLRLDRRFDLALSLEVAHYLPRHAGVALVGSIAALAPVAIFGAALPGQPGGPGANLQWPSWWADLYRSRGFRAEDWLRPLVWEDPEVDWWYAQNTILYVADGADSEPVLPLVHPGLLAEVSRAQPSPRRRRFLRASSA
jgi:SAM-dependent methyltransferase